MPATHQVIADWLARAQRRHQEETAAADARLRAVRAAAQRQCGAEPGHIFVAAEGDAHEGRPQLACAVCGIARRCVTGDTPNLPPREIEDEALPLGSDAGRRRRIALSLRGW